MTERCGWCNRQFKNVYAHVRRMHPEAEYVKRHEPRPHPQARKVTIDEWGEGTFEGLDFLFDDWHTERYGSRIHGWFIPVYVEDNLA